MARDIVLSVVDRWEPVNALQRLIADYIGDHPGESYASIARRGGMPRQTVFALAKRTSPRQTPRPDTIESLAKGLQMPLSVVRSVAGMTAGYGENLASITDERMRLLIATLSGLDDERLAAVERRARSLLQEQREEESSRKRRRRADPHEG